MAHQLTVHSQLTLNLHRTRMRAAITLVVVVLSVYLAYARVPDDSGCQVVEAPVCTEDNIISYHPHETDCALFYLCNNGHISTHSCPEGEYFYDSTDICVPSYYVRCERCMDNAPRCGDECGCEEVTTLPPTTTTTSAVTTERVTPGVPTTERVTPIVPTTERVTFPPLTTERT